MLVLNQALFEFLTSKADFVRFIKGLKKFEIEFTIINDSNDEHHNPSWLGQILADNKEILRPKAHQSRETTFIEHKKIPAESGLFFTWKTDKNMPPYMSIEAQNTEILFTEALDIGIQILREYGFQQYNIVQNQGEGQLIIIPVPHRPDGVLDVHDKVIRTSFIFWRHRTIEDYTGFSLSYTKPKNLSRLYFKDNKGVGNKLKMIENAAYLLSDWLVKSGISASDNIFQSLFPNSIATSRFVKNSESRQAESCAFCTPKTIYEQLVFDIGSWMILLNYRPTVGSKAHFLILPKYHIEDWYELDRSDTSDLHNIIQAISRSIQTHCEISGSEVITYLQNGSQAGQTMAHTHIHMLNPPQFAPYFIDIYTQMCLSRTSPLTAAEMKVIANIFGPIIYQELSQTMRPILHPSVKLTSHLQTLQLEGKSFNSPLTMMEEIGKHYKLK